MEGEFTLEGTVFCQSQLAPQDGIALPGCFDPIAT